MNGSRAPRLADSTAFAIIGFGRLLRRRLEAALSDEDVTLRHLGALGHLRSGEGVSISELARRAGVTVQSMHATIDTLVARGAIDTGGAAGRGRAANLSVTAEGQRLLAVAGAAAADLDRSALATLPDSAADAIRTTMIALLLNERA